MFESLAAIWNIHGKAGTTHLTLARVLEDRAELDRFRAALPGLKITVCRLTGPEALRIERLIRRMPPGPSRDWHLARTIELESVLERRRVEDSSWTTIPVRCGRSLWRSWNEPARKIILLLSGYDKGVDTGGRRQDTEIARKHLTAYREADKRARAARRLRRTPWALSSVTIWPIPRQQILRRTEPCEKPSPRASLSGSSSGMSAWRRQPNREHPPSPGLRAQPTP